MFIDSSQLPLRASIQPSGIYIYPDTSFIVRTPRQRSEYSDNFAKKRDSNLLSLGSARKLKKAINWMAFLARPKRVFVKELNKQVRFQLSFITLTLPAKQIHTDNIIKKEALQPFLQWLRDAHAVKKYIWKAEIQKNGNIHFHITIDKFIHHTQVRNQWNRNINKLGYVDRYRAESGNFTPPSTEIKAVKKVKNIAAYLSAYLASGKESTSKKASREYNSRIISGRLWGVSSYLAQLKAMTIEESNSIFDTLCSYISKTCNKVFHKDFIHCYIYTQGEMSIIIEEITEIVGFDWLCSSNLDLHDIGILSAAHSHRYRAA